MEHVDVDTGRRGRRRATGRKDSSKQEKSIELKKLEEKLPELVKLLTTQKEASKDLSDAVKAAAEASGLQASVVRRFVAAKAGDSFTERKRDAEQLALVFDEIPGVSGPDVVADCARLRGEARENYTIPQAIEDALWLERTPDAVISTERAKQVIKTLHAALQASPCYYKGARLGIPSFVLLAYDKAAHEALVAWIVQAQAHGCRLEKVEDARRQLERWTQRPDLAWPT